MNCGSDKDKEKIKIKNDKELIDKICVEKNENSYEQGKNCLGLRKVLGINWDIEKDLFVFNFDEIV